MDIFGGGARMKSSTFTDGMDWAALLRNAKVVDLQAVREMMEAHRSLFRFDGPPEIGAFVRLWILKHPEAGEFSIASWLYFDLPVTDDGRTVVEVFAAEIAPENDELRAFVDVARKSRFGIFADAGGTRSSHRLLELVTRRRVTVTRGVDHDPGELFFTRVVDWAGMKFMLGDTRGWPASHLGSVTDMILSRVEVSTWRATVSSVADAYEKFMKLGGPYWFSVLYSLGDDDPVLEPSHYLTYEHGPVPDLAPPQRA